MSNGTTVCVVNGGTRANDTAFRSLWTFPVAFRYLLLYSLMSYFVYFLVFLWPLGVDQIQQA